MGETVVASMPDSAWDRTGGEALTRTESKMAIRCWTLCCDGLDGYVPSGS